MTRTPRLPSLATLLLAATPALAAPSPVADYQFQNVFTSSITPAPALVPADNASTNNFFTTDTVYGNSQTVYAFGKNFGLGLNTSGLISPSTYSLVIDAKVTPLTIPTGSTTIAAKLVDFNNLLADTGLYNFSNALDFYNVPTAVGTNLQRLTNTSNYAEITLTRDALTNPASPLVTAYIGGTPIFSFADTSNLALISAPSDPATQQLHFFQNDSVGIASSTIDAESQSGDVARIRLFNAALSPTDVATTFTTTAAPEPASLLTLALALPLLFRKSNAGVPPA